MVMTAVYEWVLILIITSSGGAISQHEYWGKDSCLNARRAVIERYKHSDLMAVCVPKDLHRAK